jgi:tetratricopeptide (TPR) repeat protein
MFFPRMRRHAKWMFVLLALFMGGGFVLFGVGAGGVGIGELLRGGGGSSETPSLSEARERAAESPQNAEAQRDLATALQLEGQTDESVAALERYTELRPSDSDALRELASLYLTQANEQQLRAQNAQLEAASITGALFSQPLQNAQNNPVVEDPIAAAVESRANRIVTDALTQSQQSTAAALDAYRRLAAASPDDPAVQVELAQTAQNAGDTATAIAAYERFLKLAPDDPLAAGVRAQLKELRKSSAPSTG